MLYDAVANMVSSLNYEEQINLLSVFVDAIKARMPKKQVPAAVEKADYTDSFPPGNFVGT